MKTNKFIAGALSLGIMGTNFIGMNTSAAESVAAGQISLTASWSLNSDGVLTISGTGALENYEPGMHGYGPIDDDEVEVYYWKNMVPWFDVRSSIKKVVVSEGITSLGSSAFMDCDSLTEVELPSTITDIPYYTFFHCSNLKEIRLPESIATIGEEAFRSCVNLTEVTLPSGLSVIGDYAFEECISLDNVVIPNGTESIGKGAFRYCTALSELIILSKDCIMPPDYASISNYEDYTDYFYVFEGTIYGKEGSTAQAYAQQFGHRYVSLRLGDIDCDGAINALDASLVLAEYASNATGDGSTFSLAEEYCSDTDHDGNINALDASYILSYYAYTETGGKGTFEEFMK